MTVAVLGGSIALLRAAHAGYGRVSPPCKILAESEGKSSQISASLKINCRYSFQRTAPVHAPAGVRDGIWPGRAVGTTPRWLIAKSLN